MIELHRVPLSKATGPSQRALDLFIPDGETVVLLGSEGCGKEVLLRLLAGLEAPRSGLVRVVSNGLELSRPQLVRAGSLLVRNDPLLGSLTVRENLLLHCLLKGNGKAQARLMCEEAIECYDLEKAEDLKASSLPYDWKRYVALACVLIQRGSFLLLDEPFFGLSPLHSRRALEMIRKGAGDRTLILSLTSPEDAQVFGGRLLLFGKQRLLFDGTCSRALEQTGARDLRSACSRLYEEVFP